MTFGIDPNAKHILIADLTKPASTGVQEFLQDAKTLSPTPLTGMPHVSAWGSSGALIGGEGSHIFATIKPTVRAFIGDPDNSGTATTANVTAGDEVYIQSVSATDVKADVTGFLFTAIGGGNAVSTVDLGGQSNAYVGKDARVFAQGGDFTLLAQSNDTVDASSTAISGGVVDVFEAKTFPTLASTTTAFVGPSSVITAEGDVYVEATKATNLSATSSSVAGGVLVTPQSIVEASVGNSGDTILAFVSGGSQVTSQHGTKGIVVTASNSPQDVLDVKATGRSYGLFTGQKASAGLTLNEQTRVKTEGTYSGSELTVTSTLAWDKVSVTSDSRAECIGRGLCRLHAGRNDQHRGRSRLHGDFECA